MHTYKLDKTIHASNEKVWQALIGFDNYALWNPIVPRISGSLKTGSVLAMTLSGHKKPVAAKVKSVEDKRYLILSRELLHPAILQIDHHFELEIIEKGTTHFSQRWVCSGLLTPVLWSMITKRLAVFEEFNEGLKRYAEP